MTGQTDSNAMGTESVPGDKLPADSYYKKYQDMVNAGDVPSEQVIAAHMMVKGKNTAIFAGIILTNHQHCLENV